MEDIRLDPSAVPAAPAADDGDGVNANLRLLQPVLRATAETHEKSAGRDDNGRRKLVHIRLEGYSSAGTAEP